MNGRLFGLAFITAAALTGCDPMYYLVAVNESSQQVIIRLSESNEQSSVPDLVVAAPPGRAVWLMTPVTGQGPDQAEVLADDCRVVDAVAVPRAGVIRISANLEADYEEVDLEALGHLDGPIELSRCPNR